MNISLTWYVSQNERQEIDENTKDDAIMTLRFDEVSTLNALVAARQLDGS